MKNNIEKRFLAAIMLVIMIATVLPLDVMAASPNLTTEKATDITEDEAHLWGYISTNGGNYFSEYGFYWGTTSNPSTKLVVGKKGSKTTAFDTPGRYDEYIDGLKEGTKYYYCAYVKTTDGTVYKGGVGKFSTKSSPKNTDPTLTTKAASNIKTNSATLNGKVDTNGGNILSEYGFYWGTTNIPSKKVAVGTKGNKTTAINTPRSYDYDLNQLKENTKYYFCSYVKTSSGKIYKGNVKTFTTSKGTTNVAPTINTVDPSDLLVYSVTLNGEAVKNGGNVISEYGFYWGTSKTPNKKVAVGTKGSKTTPIDTPNTFSYSLTGLSANTTYYFCSYVKTGDGKIYKANVLSFKTLDASLEPLRVNSLTASTSKPYILNDVTFTIKTTQSAKYGVIIYAGEYELGRSTKSSKSGKELKYTFKNAFTSDGGKLITVYPLDANGYYVKDGKATCSITVQKNGDCGTPTIKTEDWTEVIFGERLKVTWKKPTSPNSSFVYNVYLDDAIIADKTSSTSITLKPELLTIGTHKLDVYALAKKFAQSIPATIRINVVSENQELYIGDYGYEPPVNEEPKNHIHNYEYTSTGLGTHLAVCVNPNCDMPQFEENCEYDVNGVCKYCGYKKSKEEASENPFDKWGLPFDDIETGMNLNAGKWEVTYGTSSVIVSKVSDNGASVNSNLVFFARDKDGKDHIKHLDGSLNHKDYLIKDECWGMRRGEYYEYYVMPSGTTLTDDNESLYSAGAGYVPLFKNMIISIMVGDDIYYNGDSIVLDDDMIINWDGNHGIDYLYLSVKNNGNIIYENVFDYDGPGQVRIKELSLSLGNIEITALVNAPIGSGLEDAICKWTCNITEPVKIDKGISEDELYKNTLGPLEYKLWKKLNETNVLDRINTESEVNVLMFEDYATQYQSNLSDQISAALRSGWDGAKSIIGIVGLDIKGAITGIPKISNEYERKLLYKNAIKKHITKDLKYTVKESVEEKVEEYFSEESVNTIERTYEIGKAAYNIKTDWEDVLVKADLKVDEETVIFKLCNSIQDYRKFNGKSSSEIYKYLKDISVVHNGKEYKLNDYINVNENNASGIKSIMSSIKSKGTKDGVNPTKDASENIKKLKKVKILKSASKIAKICGTFITTVDKAKEIEAINAALEDYKSILLTYSEFSNAEFAECVEEVIEEYTNECIKTFVMEEAPVMIDFVLSQLELDEKLEEFMKSTPSGSYKAYNTLAIVDLCMGIVDTSVNIFTNADDISDSLESIIPLRDSITNARVQIISNLYTYKLYPTHENFNKIKSMIEYYEFLGIMGTEIIVNIEKDKYDSLWNQLERMISSNENLFKSNSPLLYNIFAKYNPITQTIHALTDQGYDENAREILKKEEIAKVQFFSEKIYK